MKPHRGPSLNCPSNRLGPLSFAEGRQRGRQDRAARKVYDPYRWVHAWARDFWRFEQGYAEGFYS